MRNKGRKNMWFQDQFWSIFDRFWIHLGIQMAPKPLPERGRFFSRKRDAKKSSKNRLQEAITIIEGRDCRAQGPAEDQRSSIQRNQIEPKNKNSLSNTPWAKGPANYLLFNIYYLFICYLLFSIIHYT